MGVQFLGAEIPLILLSGMAADERLFQSQLAAFPNFRIQPWIFPLAVVLPLNEFK